MKPYLRCQKIPLVGLLDRRRKLTDEDRKDIKNRFANGETMRGIGRVFKVSHRLVGFVVYPERLEQFQKKNAKEQHWKKYHNREQLTKAVKNWRNYKYKLFKNKI